MSGHYHIEFQDGSYLNRNRFSEVLQIAKNAKEANALITKVFFVCSFGCGVEHPLTKDEAEKLKNI